MKRIPLLAVALGLLLVPLAHATVPGQVNFQGLLLDDLGDRVTATVGMSFEIFDAAAGGNSLWTESHPSVQVVDGVYDVILGETSPLTAALVAGGSLHLEVTVDGETLAPRQALLMVPYALRSEVSESTERVDGFEAQYMGEMVKHFSFDGEPPGNLDPREGLADTDGDGLANFVDADNDGDGLNDGAEIAQGSNINLVTPTLTGFSPAIAEGFITSSVQVQGTSFQPGLTVIFGSESPVPTNVTSTSFDVQVGPQPAGPAAVTVTLPNGEADASSFDFVFFEPQIDSFSPSRLDQGQAASVTVTGQNFASGMTVAFGSQTPTPTNITPTSFEIAIAGTEPPGFVDVSVTLLNGNDATSSTGIEVSVGSPRLVFATSTNHTGNLGGIAGADAICNGLASTWGLEGTFHAWLADSTRSPSTRDSQAGAPYVRVDGVQVADDWSDLTDGDLDAPILLSQASNQSGPVYVWTNVAAVGAGPVSFHCQDWTSSSGAQSGRRGNREISASDWTEAATGAFCSSLLKLYCFEQ